MNFSALNDRQSKRYHQQKLLIKRVLQGKKTHCERCESLFVVSLSEDRAFFEVRCDDGCTHLTLEID